MQMPIDSALLRPWVWELVLDFQHCLEVQLCPGVCCVDIQSNPGLGVGAARRLCGIVVSHHLDYFPISWPCTSS